MFGAWDKATPDGRTVQLRALDWVKYPPYYRMYRVPSKNSHCWLFTTLPALRTATHG